MPMVARLPATFTHSCSFVYLSESRVFIEWTPTPFRRRVRCLRGATPFLRARQDVHAVARYGARLVERETGQLLLRPRLLLGQQRGAPDEVGLGPADGPVQAGLDRRGRVVDIIAVEAVADLEAQRVPRGE